MIGRYRPGVGAVVGDSVVLVWRPGGFLWHFVETAHIIRLVSTPPPLPPLCWNSFSYIRIYVLAHDLYLKKHSFFSRDIARRDTPRVI
jgi:hypothetical protein